MIDLLITGGRVLDGTGAPGIYASVAVEGDRLRIFRGEASDVEAVRTIDATGKIVCPGFIDIHAHSSLVILDDPEHMPKVHQGVTTEVIGIDGVSYAPFQAGGGPPRPDLAKLRFRRVSVDVQDLGFGLRVP